MIFFATFMLCIQVSKNSFSEFVSLYLFLFHTPKFVLCEKLKLELAKVTKYIKIKNVSLQGYTVTENLETISKHRLRCSELTI